jgi:hypothetical protein
MSTKKSCRKEHYFLDSSFIKHVALEDDNLLIVTFSSNSVWAYYDVPEQIYEELISSTSIGSYFNKNIRNVYSSNVLFKISSNSKIIYHKDQEIVQEEEKQKQV